MKNKNLFASILTVTAGLAAPMTYTAPALAKSASRAEAQLKDAFSLKTKLPARYTDGNGDVTEGFLYFDLHQQATPFPGKNLLTAEMIGYFYFSNGKFSVGVTTQGENDVLLDLIHKDAQTHKYQVYGCSTTMGYCETEQLELHFNSNKTMELVFGFSEKSGVEVQMTGASGQTYWSRFGHSQMDQVTR